MDDIKNTPLIIDPEFRDLIRPLRSDEYITLEENLKKDGCREPITLWRGIIVDGHNRYEICTRLGIPFKTVNKEFDSREDTIAWICANQLGRRNITEETRKYLIGKRYSAEKTISARKNQQGVNQYTLPPAFGDTGNALIPTASQSPRTSERLGAEYHMSHATIEKYGAYASALDQIAEKDPALLPKILGGRYKISHDNIVALSKLQKSDVRRIGKKMKKKEVNKGSEYIPFRFTREQINTSAKPDGSGLQPAIKSMPQFDPDSEVTGLALTIPSWANSIERTRNNTDLSIVSSEAKNNLEKALSDLLEVISEIMLAIKE